MRQRTDRKLHPVEKADLAAAEQVHVPARSTTGRWLASIADLGDQPPLVAVCAGVLAAGIGRRDYKMIRTGLRMLAAHALATATKAAIKNRVDRTRPGVAREQRRYRMKPGTSRDGRLRSMPSGHSAGLAAVTAALAREYPAAGGPAAAGAGVVAAAQLPSGNHFVTDVAAGIAIGLASEAALARLMGPPSDEV